MALGRSFRALMVAQFAGAFNDNLFKTYLSLLIVATVAASNAPLLLSVATALFVLPNFFLSTYAGWCADRFGKQRVIVWVRGAEVAIVVAGVVAILSGSIFAMMLVLLFLGVQSTFFAPVKYGVLPELLPVEPLSEGNGYLELWTFLAILCGTSLAGALRGTLSEPDVVVAVVLLAATTIGFIAPWFIERTPPQNPELTLERNITVGLRDAFAEIRTVPYLRLTNWAIAWFWAVGAFGQMGVILLAQQSLGLSELGTGVLVTALAVGIGAGSVLAGKLSHHRVELGLVPLGAVGIAVALGTIGLFGDGIVGALLGTVLLGLSGGGYIVPLYAYFQSASDKRKRGKLLAASNVLSYGGMLAAAVYLPLTTSLFGWSIQASFLLLALLAVGLAVWVVATLPDALVRAINFLLTHLCYRVEVRGLEKLPKQGGALLCANHVSYVDASLILAVAKRPVRFLMYRKIYELPLVHHLAKAAGAIPVMAGESKERVGASLAEATNALTNGDLVCIFPEGGITRDGELKPFKRGLERIVSGTAIPIYPVALRKLWGSIFSFSGRPVMRLPNQFPYPVEIVIGDPLPATATAEEVREAVARLVEG